MDPESIIRRLVGIRPIIHDIQRISGNVGLSFGIAHQGQIIFKESFGYRNAESKLPVDSQTMFSICSMTKGLVSSALGLLVEDKKIAWDDLVSNLLPTFEPKSGQVRSEATLCDLLSMRSGLERYNVWSQSHNRINFAKTRSVDVINSLRSATDLRSSFSYNNWGYEIAAHIFEQVEGKSWDRVVHEKFFEPLELQRTDASGDRDKFDNITESYMVLDDGTPFKIPITPQSGKTLMGAGGGVVSCVDDLLVLYSTILEACVDQFERGATTPSNPFVWLTDTMSAHSILPGDNYREASYGMGWIRTQLPNQMCKISPNVGMIGTAPVVGEGSTSRLIISHYGSMPGSYSGVIMLPETRTIIVVLINTTPRCDLADWITQLLVQTVFDFPNKNDYVHWVKRTVDAELGWHSRLLKKLAAGKKDSHPQRKLSDYTGRYWSQARTMLLEIELKRGELQVLFEGRSDETFSMSYYRDETFSWLQPRNDLIRRARTVGQDLSYYLLRFEGSPDGKTESVFWTHDTQLPMGEQFMRE